MKPPLTKKRKQAIIKYVIVKALKGQGNFVPVIIENTLKAERMKADTLYEWLQKRGYRWNGYYWTQ